MYPYFWLVKAALPHLKAGASIIATGSIAGIQGSPELPDYSATKGAIHTLTKTLAQNLVKRGIRVNCVAPGFVRSNPASERQWHAMGEAGQQRLVDGIALRRIGTPEDIARAVLFFCADDSGYVTGQTISVDGGMWMLG